RKNNWFSYEGNGSNKHIFWIPVNLGFVNGQFNINLLIKKPPLISFLFIEEIFFWKSKIVTEQENEFIQNFIHKKVKVGRGGPESKSGYLLGVFSDYIILWTDKKEI